MNCFGHKFYSNSSLLFFIKKDCLQKEKKKEEEEKETITKSRWSTWLGVADLCHSVALGRNVGVLCVERAWDVRQLPHFAHVSNNVLLCLNTSTCV